MTAEQDTIKLFDRTHARDRMVLEARHMDENTTKPDIFDAHEDGENNQNWILTIFGFGLVAAGLVALWVLAG